MYEKMAKFINVVHCIDYFINDEIILGLWHILIKCPPNARLHFGILIPKLQNGLPIQFDINI